MVATSNCAVASASCADAADARNKTRDAATAAAINHSLCDDGVHNLDMEYRQLGHSGLKVSALSFGAGTFGGGSEFFNAWGASDVEEATRLVGLCLDAGINLFDTADIYSAGRSEE